MGTYTEAIGLRDHVGRLEQELIRSTERIRALRQQSAQVAGRLHVLQQQGASPEVLQPLREACDVLLEQFVVALDAHGQTERELSVSQANLQQFYSPFFPITITSE